MANIPVAAIDALKTATRGNVITDSDAGYDDARSIWNAMIDHHPAVILRCAGVADVMQGLSFAREHKLPIAIRGGGHNIAGSAICNDGLVLDMAALKSVRIDPEAQRAYVEPGATLADFDHEAQAFGLATPLGINSTTGVAGLTLGGGFGWLSRRYGMTVDNLVSADVVTADGKLVRASASSHPDLFWALRGGGGNFGVVTMFEFLMHRVGPEIFGGLIVFPLDQAKEALRKYQAATPMMPDDLTVWAVLRLAPPLPFLPPEVHGQPIIAFAVCHTGATGEQTIVNDMLHDFGTPVGEHLGTMPYSAWQQAFDALLTPGARNYWKSHNLEALSDGLIDAVIDAVQHLPSPQCEIFFGQIGGQTARPAADAMAYSSRATQYAMNVHGRWDDAKDDAACITWARDFFQASAPHAMGSVYVNFLTEDEAHRVKAAYGGNFDRLAQIKGRYDPENLFRNNQNIPPSAAVSGATGS